MAHGENGVFTNTLGEIYVGSWRFDKKHGFGKEIWPKDNSEYEGNYVNGERSGMGTFTKNGKVEFQGEWYKNQMHGNGTFYFPDNKIFSGHFKKGNIEGLGTMRYPDGRSYQGEFK